MPDWHAGRLQTLSHVPFPHSCRGMHRYVGEDKKTKSCAGAKLSWGMKSARGLNSVHWTVCFWRFAWAPCMLKWHHQQLSSLSAVWLHVLPYWSHSSCFSEQSILSGSPPNHTTAAQVRQPLACHGTLTNFSLTHGCDERANKSKWDDTWKQFHVQIQVISL